jgi:hypothetical protein
VNHEEIRTVNKKTCIFASTCGGQYALNSLYKADCLKGTQQRESSFSIFLLSVTA